MAAPPLRNEAVAVSKAWTELVKGASGSARATYTVAREALRARATMFGTAGEV